MDNWIELEWKDNEYVRFVCAYYARMKGIENRMVPAHDYDSRMINVGDLEAIHFLEQAFDYFLYAYERLYCFDFPGACDRVAYAVNVAME